ncbi:MAG: sulfite exporter TauE/SafE family protein [Clostridium celatum]|nr:sulfite exporter TauE/SafE family protein [Clostridium celatum]
MSYFIIICVCMLSSIIGSICGIGGGVIIKPVLDSLGIMAIKTVSFLSGCTVLSMSIISLSKNIKDKNNLTFNKLFATILALGGIIGGLAGKSLFQEILMLFPNSNKIGAIQAFLLLIITLGTLIYTLQKSKITTLNIKNKLIVFLIGIILGIISSFLGIGGGPINLVILFYFFSMDTKEAAIYSIYVIMFSQISSITSTILSGNIPDFNITILILMVLCGILGGFIGNKLNKKINNEKVDKLFIFLMLLIICINIYNIFRYL